MKELPQHPAIVIAQDPSLRGREPTKLHVSFPRSPEMKMNKMFGDVVASCLMMPLICKYIRYIYILVYTCCMYVYI